MSKERIMKKNIKSRFLVFLCVFLIIFSILGAMGLYYSKKSKKEVSMDLSNAEELFVDRYKKQSINYRYIEMDSFYFISISKNSLFSKLDTYELIYINDEDSIFEYSFLHDGIDIDIKTVYDKFISLDFSTENFSATNPYVICYIKEYKEYYVMFLIDNNLKATGDIINVKDTYGNFKKIESIDFGTQYFFKIVKKEDLIDDYKVECKLKDVGVKSFGKKEIAETFKHN